MHDQKKEEEPLQPARVKREEEGGKGTLNVDPFDSSLAVRTARLEITLRQHLAGIDQLDDVDILLESHHRGRDNSDDPRYLTVNLVGARHLQSAGTPGAGEETAGRRIGWVAGLGRRWLSIGDWLQEGR